MGSAKAYWVMLIDTYRNGYIKTFKDGVAVWIIQYRGMADYSSYERKKVKMEENNSSLLENWRVWNSDTRVGEKKEKSWKVWRKRKIQ